MDTEQARAIRDTLVREVQVLIDDAASYRDRRMTARARFCAGKVDGMMTAVRMIETAANLDKYSFVNPHADLRV